MFDAVGRSYTMFTESLSVIRRDKTLLAFPLLSGIFTIAAFAVFAFGAFFTGAIVIDTAGDAQHHVNAHVQNVLVYGLMFVWYFISWSIVLFFNVALIHCAKLRFDGQAPTAMEGIKCALSHLPRILAWAAVSASVGVILQVIADRHKIVGGIVKWIVGAVWAVATFFIVPVMIYENLSLYGSFKRSIELISKTWGEAAVAHVGIGWVMMILVMPAIVAAVFVGVLGGQIGLVVAAAGLIAWFVFLGCLSSAITGVMRAALYNYASTGMIPVDMSPDVFKYAFKAKAA